MRRRLGAAVTALVLVVVSWWTHEARAQEPPAGKPVLQSGSLNRFHQRLADLRAGRAPRVVILQIGDSHTAADYMTGQLRARFQARFGSGGRGLMQPGIPYPYHRAEGIRITQAGKWQVLSSNKRKPDTAAYGLSGYVLRSVMAGDTIMLDERSGADTLTIGYWQRPGAGSFEVIANQETFGRIETSGEVERRGEIKLNLARNGPVPAGHGWTIKLRTLGDGPVDLMDLAMTRIGGVEIVNLGFIGAQVSILGRWHWPTVAEQIKDLDPAVVLVAFGTNEGFAPAAGIQGSYEIEFEQRLTALEAAAPNAALVVVGPPDAARYPRFCLPPAPPGIARGPESGTATRADRVRDRTLHALAVGRVRAAWPPPVPPETAVCKPLTPDERRNYVLSFDSEDRVLCRWHTPPALPLVREIQRRVAVRHGALFFDWSAMLHGECGIDRWARQGLAAKDRVHFTKAGYIRAADRLFEVLMAGSPASGQERR